MNRTREDILIAIINNIENWDFDIRSSMSFEKHECELILELAKTDKEFREALKEVKEKYGNKQQTKG